jgi:hypothetical protein
MKSARRRAAKPAKKAKSKARLILALVLVFSIVGFLTLGRRSWDGNTKISVAFQQSDTVIIGIFDPEVVSITTLLIPSNTQVEVAHELGSWQLGSVWKLGEQEKIGGELLKNTIAKSFKFPVDYWASEDYTGLLTQGFSGVFKVLFSGGDTNLTFRDRLNLALFTFKVNRGDREEIDITKTAYVEETKLSDGSKGYKIRKTMPSVLVKTFSSPRVSQEGVKISIIDQTDNYQVIPEIAEIVEVLGTKVSTVKKEDKKDISCIISGPKSLTLEKLSNLFSCKKTVDNKKEGIEMIVGTKFNKNF